MGMPARIPRMRRPPPPPKSRTVKSNREEPYMQKKEFIESEESNRFYLPLPKIIFFALFYYIAIYGIVELLKVFFDG